MNFAAEMCYLFFVVLTAISMYAAGSPFTNNNNNGFPGTINNNNNNAFTSPGTINNNNNGFPSSGAITNNNDGFPGSFTNNNNNGFPPLGGGSNLNNNGVPGTSNNNNGGYWTSAKQKNEYQWENGTAVGLVFRGAWHENCVVLFFGGIYSDHCDGEAFDYYPLCESLT